MLAQTNTPAAKISKPTFILAKLGSVIVCTEIVLCSAMSGVVNRRLHSRPCLLVRGGMGMASISAVSSTKSAAPENDARVRHSNADHYESPCRDKTTEMRLW